MDIRRITPDYAVAPQIAATDMADLVSAGFRTVINNRPDAENPEDLQSEAMKAAAQSAGLTYVENPVVNGAMTMDMVTAQAAAIAASDGPVFAWCRSGTRSAIVWALGKAGEMPSSRVVELLSGAGYDIPGLGQQLDALARD